MARSDDPADRSNERPTILDVARVAGLSKSTVSNVIRNEEHVAPETRQRVLDAIEQLGYRRNAAARSLVRQRADVLGVVVGDFVNPFHAEMAAVMEHEAALRGYSTLLATTGGDIDVEVEKVRLLLEQRVAAILFLAFSGSEFSLREISAETSTVFVSFQTPLGPSVSVDEAGGAALAITHLINQGHRRIGYVTTTLEAEPQTDRSRLDGYRRVLESAGLPFDERLTLHAGTGIPGTRSRLQEFIGRADRPTAIFAASDYTALEIMDCADQLGIAIPGQLSLVGFDNIEVSGLTRIGLTTVAQPLRELARVGVETAIRAMTGQQPNTELLVPELVVRSSTGPPPTRA